MVAQRGSPLPKRRADRRILPTPATEPKSDQPRWWLIKPSPQALKAVSQWLRSDCLKLSHGGWFGVLFLLWLLFR